jgi:NitT/TauT family transport system substrate-binding protein
MRVLRTSVALIVALSLVGSCGSRERGQTVVLALPSANLVSIAAFVANDLDFFRKEDLDVTIRTVVGVGAVNAVLAGSADFTVGTASTFLRAVMKGQQLVAIANLIDRPMIELVVRKDVAERLGIREGMTLAERGRRLKGLTIAVQGIGSIAHAWPRYVAGVGGIDPEHDLHITPMEPTAMVDALRNRTIDGFATSPPFTTEAALSGAGIMWASGLIDLSELLPFGYGLLYGQRQTCLSTPDRCTRVARAFAAAARAIRDQPDLVVERVVKPRFASMNPDVLAAAWIRTRDAHARDVRITIRHFENAARVNEAAALRDETASLSRYDGLFTNEFLK